MTYRHSAPRQQGLEIEMTNHPNRNKAINNDVFTEFVINLSAESPADLDDTRRLRCFVSACATVGLNRVLAKHRSKADVYVAGAWLSGDKTEILVDLHNTRQYEGDEHILAREVAAEAGRLAQSGLAAFWENGAKPKI